MEYRWYMDGTHVLHVEARGYLSHDAAITFGKDMLRVIDGQRLPLYVVLDGRGLQGASNPARHELLQLLDNLHVERLVLVLNRLQQLMVRPLLRRESPVVLATNHAEAKAFLGEIGIDIINQNTAEAEAAESELQTVVYYSVEEPEMVVVDADVPRRNLGGGLTGLFQRMADGVNELASQLERVRDAVDGVGERGWSPS
jgi:hypothetical protein